MNKYAVNFIGYLKYIIMEIIAFNHQLKAFRFNLDL